MMSYDTKSMLQTTQDFAEHKVSREEYWKQMQEYHLILRQYSQIVKSAGLDRIEVTGDSLYIVLLNGLKIRWLPEDIRTVPNMLINHGEYEAAELHVITHLIQSCKVVFDVGANIGWYSLHMAQLLSPKGGEVYAFEPVPSTFAELAHNIAINGCGDLVKYYNVALGERTGTLQFHVPTFSGSVAASSRALFPDDMNQLIECQITTLDTFMGNHEIDGIDFIKCDVEGSELFVLHGGLKTIQQYKPIIMLEMLRKWARVFDYHPDDIILLLSKYGYDCWAYDDDEKQFVEISSVNDSCLHTNFFFLHRVRHQRLQATLDVKQAVANALAP